MKRIINLLTVATAFASILSVSNNIIKNQVKQLDTKKEVETSTPMQLTEALKLVTFNIDLNKIVSDFRLLKSSIYDTSITWTSSNTNVINIDVSKKDDGGVADIVARVTRLDVDTKVKLTATVTYKERDQEYKGNKDFEVVVLKKTNQVVSDLPLSFEDDFSNYKTGIDLGNYYKWQITNGEMGSVKIVDSVGDYNNIANNRAIEIDSKRQASNITYKAKLNANSTNIGKKGTVVLEGYVMSYGETNGVTLEFGSGSKTVASFGFNSSNYQYFVSGSKVNATKFLPVNGVWTKFRVEVRLSGYIIFKVFNFATNQYVDLTSESGNYISNAGVLSGAKGNIDSLVLKVNTGTKVGKTYLSNLKFDSFENLAQETSVNNPNRTEGIGLIEGYKKEVFTTNKNDLDAIPDFIVHDRFNSNKTYAKDIDYTVTSNKLAVSYTSSNYEVHKVEYTFKLKATNEVQKVIQTFYLDSEENTPRLEDFKVSYLKSDSKVGEDGSIIDANKAHMTISGNIYRSDVSLSYLILPVNSDEPKVEQIKNGSSNAIGHQTINLSNNLSTFFSFDTIQVPDINQEYDVYAVLSNSYGDSSIYKALKISTVINLSTVEDLYDMTINMDTKGSKYRIINDIDCSSFNWEFDSAKVVKFTGEIDGQGYTISNLTIQSTTARTGLFSEFSGVIKNVKFENASVNGLSDVGLIAGLITDGEITNVDFINPKIEQNTNVTGGEGYFGVICGRFRSDGNRCKLTNINIYNAEINGPKYIGLLTGGVGGSSQDVAITIENFFGEGSITTEGAAIGLIGRNRGSTTINNAIVYLDVKNCKKEVGAIAGHNKEGGKLQVKNIVTDLKIGMITQVTYFNNFIGSHDANTSSYNGSDVYYINEDYSSLADSIIPTKTAISFGRSLNVVDNYTQMWWEENTFIRDFDTSFIFSFNEETGKPYVNIKTEEEIRAKMTSELFKTYVDKLSTTDVLSNRHYLYKANQVYKYLSEEDKNKVTTEKAKFDQALKEYNELLELLGLILDNAYSIDNSNIGGK